MAEAACRVELTASFLERLDATGAFLAEAGESQAFDTLLAELRAAVIPNLTRFPRIGRRYLDKPPPLGPSSVEALTQLAALPTGAAGALREYRHGDCLMLYLPSDAEASVCLLSIWHQRQLSKNFARLWPGA